MRIILALVGILFAVLGLVVFLWLSSGGIREANRRDVPYQSLLKVVLADWIKKQAAA